jgi:GntR family transcriptional regulator of vanillate catabolism
MNPETLEIEAALRARILSGELPPGARLREPDLAAAFGVSRFPVREALTALARDGLAEHEVNRGFAVRAFGRDEVAEAYEMRALLEGQAARIAAERGLSREAEHAMLAAVLAVDVLLVERRLPGEAEAAAWRAHNAAFHAHIHSAVPNRFFARAIAAVRRVPLVGHVLPGLYDRALLARFNAEHRAILEAVAARQGGRAEYLMREHVEHARQQMGALIASAAPQAGAGLA